MLDTGKGYHVFIFFTTTTYVNRITGHFVGEGVVKLWDFFTWPQYSTINVLFSVWLFEGLRVGFTIFSKKMGNGVHQNVVAWHYLQFGKLPSSLLLDLSPWVKWCCVSVWMNIRSAWQSSVKVSCSEFWKSLFTCLDADARSQTYRHDLCVVHSFFTL